MRILITGIKSFTGGHLQSLLAANGYSVSGTCLSQDNNYFFCDVTNFQNVNDVINKYRPNIIIHLAAITYVAHSNVDEIYNTNIVGTKNILEAFKGLDVNDKHFIFASTANVYEPTETVINELSLTRPVNDYAISKLAGENIVSLYKQHFNTSILRFFNYTGLNQDNKFLIPKIISHFKSKKENIELGDITISRDFSDVRDISKIYLEVIKNNQQDLLLNVCSGITYSIHDIVQICEDITSHKIIIDINPKFVRPNEIKKITGSTDNLKFFLSDHNRIKMKDTLHWMLS